MNEARQVFIEDIQEKNKAKPTHFVTKVGPRVNYEEKSGKVARVNPTKRISYEEFKSLDTHEKVLYAQMIIDEWQIGVGTFAKMLGCDQGNLHRTFKQLGIKTPDKSVSIKNAKRFLKEFGKAETLEIKPEEPKSVADNIVTLPYIPNENCGVTTSGESTASLGELIALLIDSGVSMDICIHINGKEGNDNGER